MSAALRPVARRAIMCGKTGGVMAQHPSRAPTGLLSAFLDFRDVLARLIARIVRTQDVDDILQETFIRTYVASRKTQIRHPRAFMLRTARNLALNQVTSAHYTRMKHTEDFSSSSVNTATETLECQLESRERFLDFCRAVRQLPPQCRRVFVLKKVYGLSQREIAQYLDIAESTVEKHVAKGLLACMQSMQAQGHAVDATDNRSAPDLKEGNKHG